MDSPFLQSPADFILQLTNAVTIKPRGWAKSIGQKYPHARVHRHRKSLKGEDISIETDRAVPGTIVICDSKIYPGVITLFNQYLPGIIGSMEYQTYSSSLGRTETSNQRIEWLISGLEQIGTHFKKEFRGKIISIAFPPVVHDTEKEILDTFQIRYQGIIDVWIY